MATTTAKATLKVHDFAQDYNGVHVYNQKKALFSHLARDMHLLIPADLQVTVEAQSGWNLDVSALGKTNGYLRYKNMTETDALQIGPYVLPINEDNLHRVIAMNYYALTNCTEPLAPINAYLAAALRARWIVLGAYNLTCVDDAALTGETRYVGSNERDPVLKKIFEAKNAANVVDALGAAGDAYVALCNDENFGLPWVVKHADNIWASVEYTMRVRSHHFKNTGEDKGSFRELYDRFLKACYEGNFEFPGNADMFHVAHTAIHPFKVSPLPKLVAKFVAFNTVADAAFIRLSGAPTGNSVITTTLAALDTMSGEMWYKSFASLYQSQISQIEAATKAILDDKFSYHIGARLYGKDLVTSVTIDSKTVELDEVKNKTQTVAAACQGLCLALDNAKQSGIISGFALSNAKCLAKPANGAPLLSAKVKAIVEASINEIADASSANDAVKLAFASAFAQIKSSGAAGDGQSTTVVATNN